MNKMEPPLEEILEHADQLKINLSIIDSDIIFESICGKYIPAEKTILLNPCQSKRELGTTFMHEMYHYWADINNTFMSRRLEEFHAENYAIEMYDEYSKQINKYLKKRQLK